MSLSTWNSHSSFGRCFLNLPQGVCGIQWNCLIVKNSVSNEGAARIMRHNLYHPTNQINPIVGVEFNGVAQYLVKNSVSDEGAATTQRHNLYHPTNQINPIVFGMIDTDFLDQGQTLLVSFKYTYLNPQQVIPLLLNM